MDTVTLALDGESISLERFAQAVEQLSLLVDELSREADAPEMRWEIAELSVGSATTVARIAENGYEPERADQVIRSYLAVGRGLQEGATLPFTAPVRKVAQDLAGVLGDGVEALRFETPETEAIITKAPPALEAARRRELVVAYGAVTGRIQTVSSRAHLRFTLYDRLHDRAVSCYLREGEEEMVRGAWDKVATVEGLVSRHAEEGWAVSVRDITAIHHIDDEGSPRGYQRARGAVTGNPNAPSPEERIRRLRDAG